MTKICVLFAVLASPSKSVPARERFLCLLLGLRDLGLEILGFVLLDERGNLDPSSLQCPITKALFTLARLYNLNALVICKRVRRPAPSYVAGGAWHSSRMPFRMASSMLAVSA